MNEPPPETPASDAAENDLDIERIFREVSGDDAGGRVQVPNQAPRESVNYPMSREDLLVLARHWVEIILREDGMRFVYGQYSSGRHERYAHAELERLEGVLGGDVVQGVWDKAASARRRLYGEALWLIHEHGNDEERARVVAESYANLAYCEGKLADAALKARAMAHLRANPNGVFVDEDRDIWSLVDTTLPADGEGEQLTLMLMTRGKGSSLDPTSRVTRPSGWATPTWCGRWWKS